MPQRPAGIQATLNKLLVQRPGVIMVMMLRRALRFPKVTLALFAVLLLLASARLGDARMLLSIGDMLDKDSLAYQHLNLVRDKFPAANAFVVAFDRPSGQALSNDQLCAVRRWLHERDLTSGELRHVSSPFSYRTSTWIPERRELHYPPLLKLDCWQLGYAQDPDGQITRFANTPLAGVMVARSGQAIVVNMEFRDTPRRNPYGTFDPAPVQTFETSLATTFGGMPDLRYTVQGPAAFKWHFLQGMTHDQGLNIAIAGILVLLFRLFYGTWRGGLMLIGTLFVTFWLLTGLMTLTDTPFDILANSLFVMIALAATEDFLYLSHIQQRAGDGWKRHFAHLVLPSFYTSLTTVIGFGSLCISDIAPIRRLGLWAAAGSLIEWVVVFYALPAFLAACPRLRRWTRPGGRRLGAASAWVAAVRLPRLAIRALLAVGVVAFSGFFFLASNDSPDGMWPADHPFSRGLARFGELFGWRGNLELLFPASMPEADQRQVLSQLAQHANVVAVEDPYRIMDDGAASVSEARIRRTVRDDFRLAYDFTRYFAKSQDYVRTFLYLKSIDITSVRALRADVEALCGKRGCIVAGEIAYLAQFSDDVIVTLIESFLLSLALVGAVLLLLALALGSRPRLPLIVASLWGPVMLIGMVPLLLNGVNFVTCVSASVLVGMAGDNCIQFLFASRRSGDLVAGIDSAKEGSVAIMVMMALSALVFLGSDFKQPKLLGPLFAAGYLCLLVGDVWLLRGLLTVPLRSPVAKGASDGPTREPEPEAA